MRGLTLDLIRHLPKGVSAYPAAAILSNRYQQKCGPKFSHVTPVISYENPRNPRDRGTVILDPSFHIGKPILLPDQGLPFPYDMGAKKGVWRFSIDREKVLCQPGPKEGEQAWEPARLKDSLMTYRLDQILNPEEASALPMFGIDRNSPIVSRNSNGSQIAHINVDLTKKEITIKVGEEKRPSILLSSILEGTRLDADVAEKLLLDPKELNESLRLIAEGIEDLDELYSSFLTLLKKDELLRSNLRDPDTALIDHDVFTLEPYLSFICSGEKKIEGRVFSPRYQKVKVGEVLRFYNETHETICRVSCITRFLSFKEMLVNRGVQKLVPNAKTLDEAVQIYHSFEGFIEKEKQFGVVAFDLQPV